LELGRAASLYAPGTPSIADAARITVTDAADVHGIDITYSERTTARVHGVLRQASGQPLPNTLVTLALSARSSPVVPASLNSISDGAGAFEFRNVADGEYVLRTQMRTGTPTGSLPAESAIQFVQVAGADVGPVIVRTTMGSVMTGRITLEGAPSNVMPGAFSLSGIAADFDQSPGPLLPVMIRDDWSVEVLNLKGPVRLALRTAPDGWWVQSVNTGGRDAADEPVAFGTPDQSLRDVEIVLSRAGGMITGRVVDERAETVLDYSVIAFSTDRGNWYHRSRHMKAGRPDDSGAFAVDALPPGEYFVAAIDAAVTADNWQNPDLLSAMVASARRVRVEAGGRVSTDLRLARISP
jgi:hypothetical protein